MLLNGRQLDRFEAREHLLVAIESILGKTHFMQAPLLGDKGLLLE